MRVEGGRYINFEGEGGCVGRCYGNINMVEGVGIGGDIRENTIYGGEGRY